MIKFLTPGELVYDFSPHVKKMKQLLFLVLFFLLQVAMASATVIVFHDFTFDHRVEIPFASEKCGEGGIVLLSIRVGSDGLVDEARVIGSSGYADLDVAARQAALGWRYHTAKEGRSSAFLDQARIVIASQSPIRRGKECSAIAIAARARALERAPLVNPARMPRNIRAPKRLGDERWDIELGSQMPTACTPETVTEDYVVVVGADGRVHNIEARESWGVAKLDQAALDFVKSLRFTPARSKGRYVQVSQFVWVTPRPVNATTCQLRAE